MSMLGDWFFCTTMRLSPVDTHALLDTLAVLRRPRPELPDVMDAVSALDSAPPWIQLYALRPLLTAHGRMADDDSSRGGLGRGVYDGADSEETGAQADTPYGDYELGCRIGQLCDAVLSSTDHPLTAQLGVLLMAVIRDEEGARTAILKDIATPLAEEPRQFGGAAHTMPYHDLNDQIVPTLCVIALGELTRRRPNSAASDWTGESATPLAAAALRGDHGRLALLTAVEAASRADPQAQDELWRNLWRNGHGAPQLQPDLLDALARLWFGQPDLDDPPSIAVLEAEAITGDDLALWRSYMRPNPEATDEFYALLTGHAHGAQASMAAVLWQSVLWSLAAEVDPAETTARLARWWGAPRQVRAGEQLLVHVGRAPTHAADHLNQLRQLRRQSRIDVKVNDAPIAENTAEIGAAVCSPWLDRWHDGWDHGRKSSPAFRASQAAPAEPLVRLLAAASVSVSLLAELPPAKVEGDYDHLIALLFHTFDVLRDQAELLSALEVGDYVGEHWLGNALTSCIWHLHEVLMDAGTGRSDRIQPQVVADFAARTLEDGASADLDHHEQAARLARQAVGAISTIWIRRAWMRSSDVQPNRGCARWFAGDPPYALRILLAALDRLSLLATQLRDLKQQEGRRRKEIDKRRKEERAAEDSPQRQTNYGVPLTRGHWPPDLMFTAQLLREIYPADWPDPVEARWPQLDLDWYRQRAQLTQRFRALLRHADGDPEAVTENTTRGERLLLSPQHPLEVWRESTPDLENWTRVDAAPVVMRALRLNALLHEPMAVAADSYREWIEDWLDRIYAVARDQQLPLEVRTLMIRFLESAATAPAGIVYERRLASVHEATIDAILEFGRGAPRHVEMLLERLAAPIPLGREGVRPAAFARPGDDIQAAPVPWPADVAWQRNSPAGPPDRRVKPRAHDPPLSPGPDWAGRSSYRAQTNIGARPAVVGARPKPAGAAGQPCLAGRSAADARRRRAHARDSPCGVGHRPIPCPGDLLSAGRGRPPIRAQVRADRARARPVSQC